MKEKQSAYLAKNAYHKISILRNTLLEMILLIVAIKKEDPKYKPTGEKAIIKEVIKELLLMEKKMFPKGPTKATKHLIEWNKKL